ncbi:MAG: folate-binding protein, partial [Burkholderiaceae bacterium]
MSTPTNAAAGGPGTLPDGAARLSHLGVIRATGEEAAKFLHGQLTHDFALLGASEARLAALCTAKGRMQASFIGYKRTQGGTDGAPDILLITPADLLAPTLKRLSMFVLRAKVKLTDATADFDLWGLAGAAAGPAEPAWQLRHEGGADIVSLYPADGVARALLVAPAGHAAPPFQSMDESLWLWGQVRSGVADITQPIAEAFVPQMLNYESVGGVNFKKGCYPGQEVVARSQFRGTLKRRAYVAQSTAELQAGQDVFHASDSEQPT